MDMHELKRRERWAELAASIAQADHNNLQRDRRHQAIRFWFNPRQVVYEPTVAVPASEARSPSPSGVGSGAAGSIAANPTPVAALPVSGSGSRIPGRPHTLEANRISGGITWN
jgi:hypothetical protein